MYGHVIPPGVAATLSWAPTGIASTTYYTRQFMCSTMDSRLHACTRVCISTNVHCTLVQIHVRCQPTICPHNIAQSLIESRICLGCFLLLERPVSVFLISVRLLNRLLRTSRHQRVGDQMPRHSTPSIPFCLEAWGQFPPNSLQ